MTSLLVGCTLVENPTTPADAAELIVVPQPALVPSAADATADPVNRIRLIVSPAADSTQLAAKTFDVAPSAASWALSLTVPVMGSELQVFVFAYLLNVDEQGNESVQFSGMVGPLTLRRGSDATPELPLVRGPLDNLSVTSVTITSAPTVLAIDDDATLEAAVAASEGATPTVFWTSLDPTIASLDGTTVTGVAPGTARIVASAGSFADTALVLVASPDEVPPEVIDVMPAGGAIGVNAGTYVTVVFDEAIDPASVTASQLTVATSRGIPVAGTVTAQGSHIVFDPTAPLEAQSTYIATLAPGVRDVWGNERTASFQWSFTISEQVLSIVGGFNPGLGTLVAIAYDAATRNLFLYAHSGTEIFEFTQAGVQVPPAIPNPGITSNDHDLDFLPENVDVGGTVVDANALLIMHGEVQPRTVYAVDKDTGIPIDSVQIPMSDPVGLSYHAERNTFFGIDWTRDVVEEIDPATGTLLASFPVAPVGTPSWTVFYGDIEVDQATGNLMLVSSDQSVVRIVTPTGVLVADVPVGQLQISGMSGIAWDDGTRTAWISTTGGVVYQVSGIAP